MGRRKRFAQGRNKEYVDPKDVVNDWTLQCLVMAQEEAILNSYGLDLKLPETWHSNKDEWHMFDVFGSNLSKNMGYHGVFLGAQVTKEPKSILICPVIKESRQGTDFPILSSFFGNDIYDKVMLGFEYDNNRTFHPVSKEGIIEIPTPHGLSGECRIYFRRKNHG